MLAFSNKVRKRLDTNGRYELCLLTDNRLPQSRQHKLMPTYKFTVQEDQSPAWLGLHSWSHKAGTEMVTNLSFIWRLRRQTYNLLPRAPCWPNPAPCSCGIGLHCLSVTKGSPPQLAMRLPPSLKQQALHLFLRSDTFHV